MASIQTQLMTFAEFAQLPDPREGRYELRHGDLTLVAPPKHKHYRIQNQLQFLLQAAAGNSWRAGIEMPFRPLPEFEYWYADVALLALERYDATDRDGNIEGSPELVIEVISPSNTMAEMLDRRDLCLRAGAREFWLVDPDRRIVDVSTPDGHTLTHRTGDRIPLFWGGGLNLDEIFV